MLITRRCNQGIRRRLRQRTLLRRRSLALSVSATTTKLTAALESIGIAFHSRRGIGSVALERGAIVKVVAGCVPLHVAMRCEVSCYLQLLDRLGLVDRQVVVTVSLV